MDVVLLYPVYMQAIRTPDKLKRDALILYVEGLGFPSIGRFLNVSHVTVFNWIKNFGEKLEELRSDHDIEVVEIDEITRITLKHRFCYINKLIHLQRSSSTLHNPHGPPVFYPPLLYSERH